MRLPPSEPQKPIDATLSAVLTFDEIFGPYVYCPRASPSASRWLPACDEILNFISGGQLSVLGDMPVLCSAGVSTAPGLQLLRDAGVQVPVELHRFHNAQDHLDQLHALTSAGRRVVLLHAHPAHEIAPAHCWIDPALLRWLNNKANLAALVPALHVPRRRLVMPEELKRSLDAIDLPVLLKAATDQSTGGGFDVRICRNSENLRQAAAFFSDSEQVVIEEFLSIARNLCLNLAVLPDGAVRYLGYGEQVSSADGLYQGNWFDTRIAAPADCVALAMTIAANAAARGYRGLMGIDIAVTEAGHGAVYDLNFRTVGSTAALLLQASIAQRTGASVMRVRSWVGRAGYRALLDATYAAMGNGWLIPLTSYDPQADGITDAPPRLIGLLLGTSRDEVRARETELAALGLN